MNKILLTALALSSAISVSFSASAKNLGGGFTGPVDAKASTSVEEAKQLSDDSYVVLRGKSVKSVGHEKYLFEDKSGSIVIEIDDDDWKGLTVGPNDTVEIRGEVDTHWTKPTNIDVDSVSLAK